VFPTSCSADRGIRPLPYAARSIGTPSELKPPWTPLDSLMAAVSYSGERWGWLTQHGPEQGWDNPAWAREGGAGPYEPWHWEFTEAVAETASDA
jgi:hypothetical protein